MFSIGHEPDPIPLGQVLKLHAKVITQYRRCFSMRRANKMMDEKSYCGRVTLCPIVHMA